MINKFYLNEIKKIKITLDRDGYICLSDFLEDKHFDEIKNKLKSLKFQQAKNPTTHSYRFALFKFENKAFNNLIKIITKMKVVKSIAYKFTWKDYVIINDEILSAEPYDIFLDFSDWKSERGGFTYYIDSKGNYFEIPSKKNTLTIIKRNKKMNRFVKYFNNKSKNKHKYLLQFV